MFQVENIKVPVLGIVENMAYFNYPIISTIFSEKMAECNWPINSSELIGSDSISSGICEAWGSWTSAILQETTPQAIALKEMVKAVDHAVDVVNKTMEPTKLVKMNN